MLPITTYLCFRFSGLGAVPDSSMNRMCKRIPAENFQKNTMLVVEPVAVRIDSQRSGLELPLCSYTGDSGARRRPRVVEFRAVEGLVL
jgi:hypothetical protein